MTDITIPPAVLEAGARRIYTRFGANAGPFDEAPAWIRQQCENEARAAFLAMIEAWPGMQHADRVTFVDGTERDAFIHLPLTQENSDDQ